MNSVLIRRLDISKIRNLQDVSLVGLAPINIFYGNNGAGKTSVLEAIHLLSSARSFRSHKLNPLINSKSDKCLAFAEVRLKGQGFQPVGVERFKSSHKKGVIKVSGDRISSVSTLAENLPLQVLSSETFKLLEGAPAIRRQFIDWGVFHVEHRFHSAWRNAQRCLKQRNSLLRRGRIDNSQLEAWTAELVAAGELLDTFREKYFNAYMPIFTDVLERLVALEGISLEYYRGWDRSASLSEVLSENEQKDREKGFTVSGPHRADLRLKSRSNMAVDILSRGQQKLVVCALRVAQGYLLSSITGKSCVYLIDDMPSELDKNHRKALCELLEGLECQVFLTCVDQDDLDGCWKADTEKKVFHVEQGAISCTG